MIFKVIVDVSCDVYHPHHPFPIYNKITTISQPALRVNY